MHKSSLDNMVRLRDRHLGQASDDGVREVLDVGAMSLNGAYRGLFDPARWKYSGLDLAAGPNVDIVAEDPYDWPIETARFDAVVSGQVFEHVEFFWLSIMEVRRVLKPGGVAFIVAPSRGPQHRHPVDCWRFYPDAYAAMAKWSGLELLEVNNPWKIDAAIDFDSMFEWGDSVGVFRRPVDQPNELGAKFKDAATAHLREVDALGRRNAYPVVRIPRSRDSYFSFLSNIRFRFRKHFLR